MREQVGARDWRAPEFQHGRVEDVKSAGDIFSIGKLLWYFVNGEKSEVFPFTLWFQQEYDLSLRWPDVFGIEKLNLLIGECCHHNIDERISYDNLEIRLSQLADLSKIKKDEVTKSKATEKILKQRQVKKLEDDKYFQ